MDLLTPWDVVIGGVPYNQGRLHDIDKVALLAACYGCNLLLADHIDDEGCGAFMAEAARLVSESPNLNDHIFVGSL